jgi:hypothetical protein
MQELGLLSGSAIFLLLGLIGCALLGMTATRAETFRFQLGLFLAAYGLRFAISLALYAFGVINLIKDEDGVGWLTGVGYYQDWVSQGLTLADAPDLVKSAFLSSNKGYYYFLGFLYCLIEPARLPAAAFNCFFGAYSIVLAYRTAACLFSSWVARRVGIWLCVFPSMLIWSSQTVKEPIVILLETMVVYGCVRLRQSSFPLPHMFIPAICIVLLIPFRFYAAYLAAAALIVSAIIPATRQGAFNISGKLGVFLICGFFVTTGVLARHEAQFAKYDLAQVQKVRTFVGKTTGSGFQTDLDIRTPGGFGLSLTIGAAHLLLAPFPWQLATGSVRMLMVSPEMVYWWWLVFVGLLPGLKFALRQRFNDVLPLLVMLIGFGLLYSITFNNVGLIYRQRAQLMPWLLTFAAVGLELRLKRRMAQFAARRQPNQLPSFAELERRPEPAGRPPDSGPPALGSPGPARTG